MASFPLFSVLVFLFNVFLTASAIPVKPSEVTLRDVVVKRTDPSFPSDIPSCQVCQANYGSIDSCAAAAPVLANFTTILFNPGAFIDVIKCACTDTFQSAYPQCADCFERTNQTALLNNPDIGDTLNGLRTVCGSISVTLSNVTNTDGEPVASNTPSSATRTELRTPTALLSLVLAGVFLGAISVL